MSLYKIMAITGMPGLFKVIAQTRNGFIAESLSDKKRFPVNSNQQVNMLADISIFTTSEDVKLTDIFKNMKTMPESETLVPADADGATLKSAFKKILPEFDEDRVYASDIKKIFKWYNALKDIVDFSEEIKSENEAETSAVAETVPPPETPSKKTKAAKKEVTEGEEKPKKKTKKVGSNS